MWKVSFGIWKAFKSSEHVHSLPSLWREMTRRKSETETDQPGCSVDVDGSMLGCIYWRESIEEMKEAALKCVCPSARHIHL